MLAESADAIAHRWESLFAAEAEKSKEGYRKKKRNGRGR
jgi:hypothetical protein